MVVQKTPSLILRGGGEMLKSLMMKKLGSSALLAKGPLISVILQGLVDRIYLYFEEINQSPVVHHWKYKMDEVDAAECIDKTV